MPLKFSATISFKCSVKKSFNIQELLHCKSKRHGTKAYATLPPLGELSKENQEHNLKHRDSVDLISTKQNKQTTFLHR